MSSDDVSSPAPYDHHSIMDQGDEEDSDYQDLEDMEDIDSEEIDSRAEILHYLDAEGDSHDAANDEDGEDEDDDDFDPDFEADFEEEEDDQDEIAEGLDGTAAGRLLDIIADTAIDAAQDVEQTEDAGNRARQNGTFRSLRLSRTDLLRVLNHAHFTRIIYEAADDDDDDDDDDEEEDDDEDNDDDSGERITNGRGSGHTRGYGAMRAHRPRRPKRSGSQFPKIPSDEGRALMESGIFGTTERPLGQIERRKKLASQIMRRELGLSSLGSQRSANRLAAQGLIPSSNADTIIHYDHRCYSGQFSDDGNFFFSCSQDFHVRMYDTSNPYNWKYYKTVIYPYGQWTITDASLSPDNKFLAYSSIKSTVCLAATDPENEADPIELDFSDYNGVGFGTRRRPRYSFGPGHFGIWSIRFSGDGRELVAGTSDNSVYAYDLETRQTVLRIRGHEDDVNAVCFGDKLSPHLLYSGSDDTLLKVWDRRSMSDNREAGVFFGHREGLTYVDSKGDGRYVLSNGKDQTMKLWDLRKMMSTENAKRIDPQRYTSGFDYRFQEYDEDDYEPHPHDCSVVTFRGHKVLKTLIRCHFSPPGSTDNRYVYTGSEDGSVVIYNLDATEAGRVNVTRATQDTRPRNEDEPGVMAFYPDDARRSGVWKTCVRDASWHPNAPVIAATSWNGYGMNHGTCTVHTWTDGLDEDEAEPAMGCRVDAKLQHDQSLYEEGRQTSRMAARATRHRQNQGWLDD